MTIFDGTHEADKIAAELKVQIRKLNLQPKLVIFAIDPDDRSLLYIRAKQKRAHEIGITAELKQFKASELLDIERVLYEVAADPDVHGIMIQLPIPSEIDNTLLTNAIPPAKDVDGMRFEQLEKPIFAPATVSAILKILDSSGVNPKDKNILIIGQGEVGQPLTRVLKSARLKVTTADQSNQNLTELCLSADVIISATGQSGLITADMVKSEAIVIDVGVTLEDGNARGDVDFEAVKEKAGFITPPTGGVGPMTVICLLQNVVHAVQLT